MCRPALPSYNDDEVLCFHPVFEHAANVALQELDLHDEYRVVHHRILSEGIIVDFSIEKISNARILLLCEIKRTTAAIRSLRNRIQAQSYLTEAINLVDSNYYCLSNLEQIDLFKYSTARLSVTQQRVTPSPLSVGLFGTENSDSFYNNLVNQIKVMIETVINDTGEYLDGLGVIQSRLEQIINDNDAWHQLLVTHGFEYIRGAANNFPELNLNVQNNNWGSVEQYRFNPQEIRARGRRVDFLNLFSDPMPSGDNNYAFDASTLSSVYRIGRTSADGSDFAVSIDELLFGSSPGKVPTDIDLARLLFIISQVHLDGELNEDDCICDPCAGSGNLVLGALMESNQISPNQIIAIEKDQKYKEVLAIRIGLMLNSQISQYINPNLIIDDILNLNIESLQSVKIVLMNPPFIAGISCVESKSEFANRIQSISGNESVLNQGQIGIEALFFELVFNLVPDGTIISVIFPHRYLSGLSPEVVNFRNSLVEQFGLKSVISYPRNGIFESVVKHTFIFVCKKGETNDTINWVKIGASIDQWNLTQTQIAFENNDFDSLGGFESSEIEAQEMINSEVGWSRYFQFNEDVEEWFNNLTNHMQTIEHSTDINNYYRGKTGNTGGSELLLINNNHINNRIYYNNVPDEWKVPALRNSDDLNQIMNNTNYPNTSICPPEDAFDEDTANNDILTEFVNGYSNWENVERTRGIQPRNPMTIAKATNLLETNTFSSTNSILIPRASRRYAKIGILGCPYIVSTNFIILEVASYRSSIILGSWFSSIFCQIECEIRNLDQEGMRKMEQRQIRSLHIPNLDLIDDETYESIERSFLNDSPIDFQNIVIRDTDRIWSAVLNAEDSQNLIEEAQLFLISQISSRNSNG